jgi:hypothetical protein
MWISSFPNTVCWRRGCGQSGHTCLIPALSGNAFSFSPLSIILAVGLSLIVFIMLRYDPSILQGFSQRDMEFYQGFLHLIRWLHGFCPYSIYMLYYIWFACVEPFLHPWNKANVIVMYDLFNLLLIPFASILIKDFCVSIRQENWSIVFFFCLLLYPYLILVSAVTLVSQNEFGNFPSLSILWNSL